MKQAIFEKIIKTVLNGRLQTNNKNSLNMIGIEIKEEIEQLAKVGYVKKTFSLTFNNTDVNDASVLLGDSANILKGKKSDLSIIPANLTIGGTYGTETLDRLQEYVDGNAKVRILNIQGTANDSSYWNREPINKISGTFSVSPSEGVVDMNQGIGANDLSLNQRNVNVSAYSLFASRDEAVNIKIWAGSSVQFVLTVLVPAMSGC